MKWQPKDCIAGLVLVGCFVLLGLGRDSVITWTTFGVVCAYYGIDLTPWIKLGRRKRQDEEE